MEGLQQGLIKTEIKDYAIQRLGVQPNQILNNMTGSLLPSALSAWSTMTDEEKMTLVVDQYQKAGGTIPAGTSASNNQGGGDNMNVNEALAKKLYVFSLEKLIAKIQKLFGGMKFMNPSQKEKMLVVNNIVPLFQKEKTELNDLITFIGRYRTMIESVPEAEIKNQIEFEVETLGIESFYEMAKLLLGLNDSESDDGINDIPSGVVFAPTPKEAFVASRFFNTVDATNVADGVGSLDRSLKNVANYVNSAEGAEHLLRVYEGAKAQYPDTLKR